MLKKIGKYSTLAIASLIASWAIVPDAKADRKQECYLIDSAGNYINLSSICYATPPQPRIINNNRATPTRSTEVAIPRYDVRTYYDYGSTEFSQPVFVPVPVYNNYYGSGANFGLGYSRGKFGVDFGYNRGPRYNRGYYNRRNRVNFRGYRSNYPYRDNFGRFRYNRNGMKIRPR